MRIEDVRRAYLGKLEAQEDDEGDHIRYYLRTNGRRVEIGHVSHSWKGHLDDWKVSRLAKQLSLSPTEFSALVACDLSGQQARDLGRRRNPPRPPRPPTPTARSRARAKKPRSR